MKLLKLIATILFVALIGFMVFMLVKSVLNSTDEQQAARACSFNTYACN